MKFAINRKYHTYVTINRLTLIVKKSEARKFRALGVRMSVASGFQG